MHMLADTIGVVAGQYTVKRVTSFLIGLQDGAVTIPLIVVVARVVGLPDLNGGVAQNLSLHAVNNASDRHRHARVVRAAQHRSPRSFAFVEWSEFAPGSRLALGF